MEMILLGEYKLQAIVAGEHTRINKFEEHQQEISSLKEFCIINGDRFKFLYN